ENRWAKPQRPAERNTCHDSARSPSDPTASSRDWRGHVRSVTAGVLAEIAGGGGEKCPPRRILHLPVPRRRHQPLRILGPQARRTRRHSWAVEAGRYVFAWYGHHR